jgi:hypothetical protein
MLRVYRDTVLGAPPQFPRYIEAGIDRYLEGPRQLDADTLVAAAAGANPDAEAAPARPSLFGAPASAHEPAVAAALPAVEGVPVVASSAAFYAPAPDHRDQR